MTFNPALNEIGSFETGLFRAPVLDEKGKLIRHVFFKPVNIHLYSAPPPVRFRVVTYEMIRWSTDQQPTAASSDLLGRFGSQVTGQLSFSFTMGTMPTLLSSLLNDIRNHFTRTVLQRDAVRTKDQGLERLIVSNTDVHAVNQADGQLQVKEVLHCERFGLKRDFTYKSQGSVLSYIGQLNQFPGSRYETELEYTDNRVLTKQAMTDFINRRS